MLLYPGGTVRDPGTLGYSITLNFLSDLGTTVAYDGHSNRLGATLFVASLALLIGCGVACLIAFVRLSASHPGARFWSRAAIIVGLIVSASFVGVALTPENRAMALHVQFTRFAFQVLPLVALFLAIGAFADAALPRAIGIVWAILFAALAAYAALLQWGPALGTTDALRLYVIAQKVITAFVIVGMLVQSKLAERLLPMRVQSAPATPYQRAEPTN